MRNFAYDDDDKGVKVLIDLKNLVEKIVAWWYKSDNFVAKMQEIKSLQRYL